ncbi:MAG: response regulator [Ignavibacteriaceae bacterium]|jgi:DNA-binding response OmpR family regulator|nr:response regulator [Ignavibacteriaceae bacterium]MCZ7615985.1 response regulator [Ignavibacteriaceae bacterium]MEB2297756.1 response regulator [Ignavibacteria bacterium]NUM62789.1 response regulator [Ignavibacteriaceae bacterium]
MNPTTKSRKPVLLIVEDEVENQKFFEIILRKKFETDFCDTKKSMNKLLKENEYDAVIMDISLKDGNDGVELIKEIRNNTMTSHLPIICLSAHIFAENKIKAEQAGADIYLTKPIKAKRLVDTVEELVASVINEKK